MKERKALKHHKLPSYATELTFTIVNMFLLKLYNEKFFDAMTFFLMAMPLLAYFFVTLAKNLWDFITILHIEEMTGETDVD